MDESKPQTEVTEETRETLSVLELERTPRPEKMRLERAFFDGAHEVRYTERTFRPRAGAGLDEVRAFVDSLDVRKRAPQPLPEAPRAVPVAVPPTIPEHYREPLEAVVRGSLTSVETVHRVGTGTVVDAAWEAPDGSLQRGLYLVTDGVARPYENVATRVDELPAPPVERKEQAPAAEPAPASPTPQTDARAEKKRLLGFGRKKDAKPEPEAPKDAPAADPPAEEAPKKRRFGFGRK